METEDAYHYVILSPVQIQDVGFGEKYGQKSPKNLCGGHDIRVRFRYTLKDTV